MPAYDTIEELPEEIRRHLPLEAQRIYLDAYNQAWEEHDRLRQHRQESLSPESLAEEIAWAAVQTRFYRGDNGSWHRRR